MRGERLWWWLHPLCVTQLYRLASMAARLSSTGISHHSLFSHPLNPSLCSQQQPSPWDCSSIPKLQLPATLPSRICMAVARTVGFSFHLGCHRSAVPLSSLNVSPLTQAIAPVWGSDPCFSSPTLGGQVQSYEQSLSPLVPLHHWGLRGSIYSFLLFMYSSAVIWSCAFLCLKAYSWCIREDSEIVLNNTFPKGTRGPFCLFASLW